MDFNDIKERLERVLAALNSRFDYNVGKAITFTEQDEGKFHKITVSFEGNDPHEIENKILIILHNLANLKNGIQSKLGLNGNLVEDLVNDSLHLQVLMDLVNQEKHGSPLTKTNRSHKNPVLKEVSQGLMIASVDGSSGSFMMDLTSGAWRSEGNNAIVIHGKIFDDKNNFLFSVDELVNKSFKSLKELAINEGLIPTGTP